MLGIMSEARPGKPRGGGKHRSGGRRLAAAAPLAAVALCLLLLYFLHTSSSSGNKDGSEGGPIEDGGSAVGNGDASALPVTVAGATATHHPKWLFAAGLWAEEHVQQRLQAKASRYEHPGGCGTLPCGSQQLQRPPTLVLYAYAAADPEEQHNFDFFLKHAVDDSDWLTYRFLLASGPNVLAPASLPQLPPNARYIEVSGCDAGAWGIVATAAPEVADELAAAQRVVVVSSAARGPFLPPYAQQFMHWTDALTARLGRRTKLVGSALTCEGAPKGGDAAGEWRLNPFILPYAFATDKEGWALLSANEEVFQCYEDSWDARYYSDSGAALALLSAGFNIDSLLSKYQGLDWWNQRTWDCNHRVRPDAEWSYDGISITPHETVFVPFSRGTRQSEWSYVRQAAKYGEWAEQQAISAPQGNANAFVSEQWSLRGQRMVYMNSRGPGCFDFGYYVKHNPDMASRAAMHQQLWEHFVLVGQFQGRPHRFTCPLQVGNSYRSSYIRARGRRCFDHNSYSKANQDLRMAGINQAHELFNHYADFGQFEQRTAKYTCGDSVFGLPAGFDTRPLDPLPLGTDGKNAAKWKKMVAAAAGAADAGVARLQQQQQGVGGRAAGSGGGGQELASEQQQQQQQAMQQQAEAVRQLGERVDGGGVAGAVAGGRAGATPDDRELVRLQHAALEESAANVAEQEAARKAASQQAAATAAAEEADGLQAAAALAASVRLQEAAEQQAAQGAAVGAALVDEGAAAGDLQQEEDASVAGDEEGQAANTEATGDNTDTDAGALDELQGEAEAGDAQWQ